MREWRQRAGFARLLPFSGRITDIPYIRLSKIERGEVVPRAHELRRIAGTLGIRPEDLLIDLDAPHFSIERWATPFNDRRAPDHSEEAFAQELAAAIRLRRQGDRTLTIAAIERSFGIAPVTLSRIENAQRPFARWNPTTQAAIFALLEVSDEPGLRAALALLAHDGALAPMIAAMHNPDARRERMRERLVALRAELAGPHGGAPEPGALAVPGQRRLAVFGAAIGEGRVARTPTATTITDSSGAGARAFALRVCRAPLGGGLPGNAIVIVDPDRYPVAGGLAVIRERQAEADGPGISDATSVESYRIVAVTVDRDGRLFGYSTTPAIEIPLDTRPAEDLGAIVAAHFV